MNEELKRLFDTIEWLLYAAMPVPFEAEDPPKYEIESEVIYKLGDAYFAFLNAQKEMEKKGEAC